MKHQGKVALVTGAAQGIGMACATRLLAEGAQVALLDRDGDRLHALAARLGAGTLAISADLTGLGTASATEIVARVTERFGRLDILVNNAGVLRLQSFLDFDPDDFSLMMDVNVRAPLVLSQAAARAMIAGAAGGAIVNLTSVTAELAAPLIAGYAASKGALRQLTRVMALELIGQGIRVNAVGPGTIGTEMAANAVLGDSAQRHTVLSRTPIGRLGKTDEIAKAVSFLASDDASYIVGQTVYVDGGRLILNYVVPVAEGDA
ncbi:MAG: SDR family oxidoreductase [Burkholderiaceae bacterium]|nr:SDR family oxidoreductase [Burkholderiaceae bacterium]